MRDGGGMGGEGKGKMRLENMLKMICVADLSDSKVDGFMVKFISEVSDSEQTKRAVLKKTGTALNVILHHCTKSRLFCQ